MNKNNIEISQAKENEIIWWFPLWEFAIHIIVGTGIFIIIAIPATD